MQRLRVGVMAILMSFVLAMIVGTTGFVASRGTVAFGGSTTLTIVQGSVDVRPGGDAEFRAAADGDVLGAGTAVRTAPAAYAVITYFEGSTVSLEPETTLVIEAIGADPDGTTTILMDQPLGRTWHAVQKLLRPSSRYEVRTPSATASVRGTAFTVGVATNAQGEAVTTVETAEGAVAARKNAPAGTPQQEEVLVPAGARVTVTPSLPLPEPDPVPSPERTVTVQLSARSGVVLDPVGRANGISGGKIVLQTPGARVELVRGSLVVTLPDVPDGRVVAVATNASRRVDVVTTVTEGGRGESVAQEAKASGRSVAIGAIEIHARRAPEAVPAADVAAPRLRFKVDDAPPGFAPGAAAAIPLLPQAATDERAARPAAPEQAREDRGFVPGAALPLLPNPGGPPARAERTGPPQAHDQATPSPTSSQRPALSEPPHAGPSQPPGGGSGPGAGGGGPGAGPGGPGAGAGSAGTGGSGPGAGGSGPGTRASGPGTGGSGTNPGGGSGVAGAPGAAGGGQGTPASGADVPRKIVPSVVLPPLPSAGRKP